MTRKVDTRMTPWIGPREVRRERAQQPRDVDRRAPISGRDPTSVLDSIGVPEALIDAHGEALAGTAADLAAIAYAGRSLAPHRKRQLDLALKQLYAILGRALDGGASNARPAIAAAICGELRAIVERERGRPQQVPALYAALGLLDLSVRRGAALPAEARAVVLDLLDRTEGQSGRSSLLTVLPNLAEHLDLAASPASDRARAELWRATAEFLIDAAPSGGVDSQTAAAIAEHGRAIGTERPLEAALQVWRASFEARRSAVALALAADERPVARALAGLLEANPVGPEALFVSIERAHASLAANDELAPLISSLHASPAAASLLDAIAAGRSETLLELTRDPRLETLRPGLRSAVIAALLSAPGEARIEAVIAKSERLEEDAPYAELRTFAERHAAAEALLVGRRAPLGPELAFPLAEAAGADLPSALETLAQIAGALPKAELAELVPAIASLTDPHQKGPIDQHERFAVPPLSLVPALLEAVRPARAASEASVGGRDGFAGLGPAGRKRQDGDLAQLVLAMARGLGRIGSDRHLHRALEDLLPAINSSNLGGAQSALAVRAHRPIQQLLESPLPAEVRATAQRFLTAEQLAWAEAQVGSARRDTHLVIDLRDFIFGCVDAGRLDAIEAARRSTSPRRALQAVLREVAQGFRIGTLGTVLFDPIVVGLRAGRAPMADILRAEDASQLAIDLVALSNGRVTDDGREQLKACAERINWLLSICVPEGPTYDPDIDMASLRPVLLACIEAAATGAWPALKYENAAGQRIMARLAVDQRALWRKSLVTPASAPPLVDNPDLTRAVELARGMAVAIPELIELGGAGLPPLGWDDASIENLEAVRDDALEALRAAPKGSDAHRDAVRILLSARENLALLTLYRALVQTAVFDPPQAMLRLRPSLEAAKVALAERGGEGFREAIHEILSATEHLSGHAREGTYAVDEDSLPALLNSHLSGCLSSDFPGLGRQYGLVGGLADANIRMLRVMNGETQRMRGFMKFFDVALEGYRGPALFLDTPVADGGGDEADLELWYRHAVEKAKLMGMPVMVGKDDPGADRLARLGSEAGLAVRRNLNVEFSLDDGNTGYMHSDTLFAGKGNIRASRGEQPVWSFWSPSPTIVMPPGSA